MGKSTLQKYVKKMREDGGGTPNFQALASASGNPGSSIPYEAAGGGTPNFEALAGNPGSSIPNDARAAGGGTPNFEALASGNLVQNAKKAIEEETNKFLAGARQKLYERQYKLVMQSVPGFDATPYLPQSQSTRWTGAPNFSKAPGSSSHQQAPPTDDTFVPLPSQAGTDSTNWFGDDGSLYSVVNPKNPSSWKNAWGAVSNLLGASPQEPQFSPSMHDTPAASSYYSSNQPDDGSLQSLITPRNQKAPQIGRQSSNFTSGNPGAWNRGKSTNFSKAPNSGNWSFSSITGFGATAHLPNQSPSTGWLNFSKPAPSFPQTTQIGRQSSNFTSGNPGSSEKGKSTIFSKGSNPDNWPRFSITGSAPHYGGAMPYQQVLTRRRFSQINRNRREGPAQCHPNLERLLWMGAGEIRITMKELLLRWSGLKTRAHRKEEAGAGTPNFQASGNPGSSIPIEASAAGIGAPNLQASASASGNPGSSIPNKASEDGGGTPNFQASASGNPGSSIPNKASAASGSSRKNAFEKFKDNPGAMALVEQHNNNEITDTALFEALKRIKPKLSTKSMYFYLKMLNEEKKAGSGAPNLQAPYATAYLPNQSKSTRNWDFSNPTKDFDAPPFPQAPQIAQQSSNFTSGNPGSSEKGKSTNFSKAPNSDNWSLSSITGASSHYGGAMPSQQAPMPDTFMPSQAETDSTNWFEENSQNDDGSLHSMVNPKNPSSWKNAWGAVSNLFGASPQEPQFSPSMHVTPAASSYYSSNQPDDGSLESLITPRNQKAPQIGRQSSNFTSGNPGASNRGKSTNFSKAPNSGNWSLSSITGFGATAHLPNQSPFSKPAPSFPQTTQIARQSSNFTSGNPGSSEKGKSTIFSKGSNPDNWPRFSITGSAPHYGGAMPYQQVLTRRRRFSQINRNRREGPAQCYPNLERLLWIGAGEIRKTMMEILLRCILKNSYCVTNYEEFKSNADAMNLVKEHYDFRTNTLKAVDDLLQKLRAIKPDICKRTLQRYVQNMRKAGGGTPNFQASASGNPGSSIPNDANEAGGGTPNFQASVSASGNPGSSIPNKATEAGGGSRQITYKGFRDDPRAMALVERYNNNPISNEEMLKELEKINHKMCLQTLYKYLNQLREEKVQEAGGLANLPATQIAGQSYNFTSGNPGSSTSKGKSTNFLKAPGASSHYGGALPSQQAPPMYGTDVPSQAGIDSTNWLEENSQNDDGNLYSVVRPKNTSSWKNAWGSVSSWFGASPQEPQFSPSMHVTPAASSYYSSNQPDDGSLESLITPRNQKGSAPHYGGAMPYQQAPPKPGTLFPAFSNQSPNQSAPSQSTRRTGAVLSQPGTPSLDWSGGNSQNNDGDLASEAGGGTPNFQASVSASGNPGSSIPNKASVQEAGGGVPNLPATQIAGQSYNFTAGNPGSSKSVLNKGKSTNFSKAPGASSHYGGAMPSQQAPQMHGTDVPSQAGTDSTNWVEENSQNDDGSLYSVVRPKNTSSWKNAWGAVSSWFGASPQEPQFSPSMHVTPAASSYYSSNQPDDGSLESLITPRNQKGSAPHYGGAIPFQQAPPMPGTLFPAFSNQSPNQSAPSQSTRRTGAVLSQPGTPSLDWSGGNSQNNDGDLASVVRPKNPSSSKGLQKKKKQYSSTLR
uniref:Uncharacterized protein n=1 Tax=Globodera rostochiensis TaxID=31243 RepID=A0A914I4Z1_GLORO